MRRIKHHLSDTKGAPTYGGTFRSGFTLMELLIVIAIIGILVSVAVVSYGSAQKKSRDSRRISDMKAVQSAWEQYYADNSANYPATCTISTTYLPGGFPLDPKTGVAYSATSGWASCAATSYCFCAGLEGQTNATTDCSGASAPAGYTGLTCVGSLQ